MTALFYVWFSPFPTLADFARLTFWKSGAQLRGCVFGRGAFVISRFYLAFSSLFFFFIFIGWNYVSSIEHPVGCPLVSSVLYIPLNDFPSVYFCPSPFPLFVFSKLISVYLRRGFAFESYPSTKVRFSFSLFLSFLPWLLGLFLAMFTVIISSLSFSLSLFEKF